MTEITVVEEENYTGKMWEIVGYNGMESKDSPFKTAFLTLNSAYYINVL